jgi:PAS domain-containing protein
MTTETQGARPIDPLDLRNLIETMPAPVVCALSDGSVELANLACLEYAGCSVQQSSGRLWQSRIHPDDIARFTDEWIEASAGGKPFQAEARFRGPMANTLVLDPESFRARQ